MHNGANPQPRPRVTSRAEAERLLEAVLAAIAALETTVADESSDLRLGRIAAGHPPRARQRELTPAYLSSVAALETTVADESSDLRLGRIAAGLACGARKSELTATYLQSLEAVKANAARPLRAGGGGPIEERARRVRQSRRGQSDRARDRTR